MTPDAEKIRVSDDGLVCPEIRRWAETKYRLIALYDELFATGMKNKWHQRVYIDLYSAAGYGRIKGTQTILMGSPLIDLTVAHPFDKYIFCQEDEGLLEALTAQVKRIAPKVTCGEDMPYFSETVGRVKAFIEGPWVDQIAELLRAMNAFRQESWKKKNAPREAQNLKQDMKSFGLE